MTPPGLLYGVGLFLAFFVGVLFGITLERSAYDRVRDDLEDFDA